MEFDLTKEVEQKVEERNTMIQNYNIAYKDVLKADSDAARNVSVTYATKMNEMNINTYKYGVIAAIAIIAFIVYRKYKK
jgi:hypothetical protein